MKQWRLDFRVWHWINAVVILGLLGTVFLRKTFLSWRTNSDLLSQKLAEMNLEVTTEQAKVLAKTIRAPMWEWHILLGYALVALLLWRTALFFTQSGKQNYQDFKQKSLHKKMVTVGYVGIYAILSFMAVTGLLMHFHEILGITKELTHSIKEIHELVFNVVLIFVPLHIIGVIVAENRDEKGIVSEMIHGGSEEHKH
ncbi:MAG: Ni,Fe-hydrogenase I cytochrome b subunit [uncultured Sulfurovum sp.]|uniref:Ni,Fe-hydrogenase I cytochrome b subunit n=1 Tax=uncultured Sulfurovum sp. TaxID=269237 RepID=A0A6S6RUU2_9BACT|nr:MAG: Ni,Fe-hydrogenase I cytochrome b subunit [uncultured Sulfurovum sp.]